MVFSAGSFGPARLRVLVAETDALTGRQVAAALAAGLLNAEVEIATSLELAEARLRGTRFSAVVAGLYLGEDAVGRLRPLIAGPLLMIGAGAMTAAVEVMRRGADDFILAPFAPQALVDRVLARIAEKPVEAETSSLPAVQFEGFVGHSGPMRAVYGQIERVAGSKAPVFVTGESGTGKELAAQAVHLRSGRAGPFVTLHCGTIPNGLAESELFGHVRGAFAGALEDHAGAAEQAHGGTLFIEDICELDAALQSKLLRLVQTGEVRRLGGTGAKRVDVRLVCATNRDPKAEVAQGTLREDLFQQLNVLPIALPPLRLRGEDTLLLARTFLARASREEGRQFGGFDPLAERLIASYSWPGNVRELESAIRRVVVLNEGGVVTADMLPAVITTSVLGRPEPRKQPTPDILPMWVQEERIIEQALAAFGGNIARAAAALEINPSTIYRRRSQTARRTAAE